LNFLKRPEQASSANPRRLRRWRQRARPMRWATRPLSVLRGKD
jgi:hypothetical protein